MSSSDASMSSFSANGSPTWTEGRFDGSSSLNVAGEHGRAADPVAAGRRAEEDDEVAGSGRRGERESAPRGVRSP
jgi:hypothetical protein